MENIKNKVIEIGVKPQSLNILGKDLLYFYHQDRFYLIHSINSPEEMDLAKNVLIELSTDEIQKKIIDTIKLSEKDQVDVYQKIKSFLWDIYFIVVYIPEAEEKKLSEEVKSRFERDKFIARKIIIEELEEDKIKEQFQNLFNEKETISGIIAKTEPIFKNDEEHLLNSICSEEVLKDIKERLKIDRDPKLKDIIEYINKIQKV